jgi:hypothetical protein
VEAVPEESWQNLTTYKSVASDYWSCKKVFTYKPPEKTRFFDERRISLKVTKRSVFLSFEELHIKVHQDKHTVRLSGVSRGGPLPLESW